MKKHRTLSALALCFMFGAAQFTYAQDLNIDDFKAGPGHLQVHELEAPHAAAFAAPKCISNWSRLNNKTHSKKAEKRPQLRKSGEDSR
jgi:hypothetical protein